MVLYPIDKRPVISGDPNSTEKKPKKPRKHKKEELFKSPKKSKSKSGY